MMNKGMREKVTKEIENSLDSLFKKAGLAVSIQYTGNHGVTETEDPGTYNHHLTELMIYDARNMSLFGSGKNKELSEVFGKTASMLGEYDLAVRRRLDDWKDNRPLTEFPFDDDLAELISHMSKLTKEGRLEPLQCKDIREKSKAWIERLLKLSIYAWYIEKRKKTGDVLATVDMRGFDEDGNLVWGISEKDADAAKTIASIMKLMLKSIIRLPAGSEEIKDAMGRAELMEAYMTAIAEADEDFLERFEDVINKIS